MRHGEHKYRTMSFRPTTYEREQILARVTASGMGICKYITHSCIYQNVCVVGKRETIMPLVNKLNELEKNMTDLALRIREVDTDAIQEVREEYLALVDGILWMLSGAKDLLMEEK